MQGSSAIEDLPPSWLNNSFLETALKTTAEEILQVKSYHVARATAAGDNYSSEMLRVEVHLTRNGQSEKRSIVLKIEPSNGEMAKRVAKAGIFQRESTALSKIVPKIHHLIQQASPEKIQPFAAECLYSHFGPPATVIVLDDLKARGFRMAERTEGLDKDHCLLVLRTLAKYHAASVIQYKQDPELFETFDKSIYNENTRDTVLKPFFENSVRDVAKEMKNWPEFDKRFSEQLEQISEIAATFMIQSGKKKDGDFNVLNHGDLWLNNMMFRYSDATGQVQDVRFLDFPVGLLGNAALDLQYFLHTSPSIELMKEHDFLLEEYHKALGDAFTLLGNTHLHPTFDQLKKQIDEMGMYGVIISCSLLPIILSDRSDVPDLDKIWNNEKGMSYSRRYKNVLKVLFPIFENNGWINIENFSSM